MQEVGRCRRRGQEGTREASRAGLGGWEEGTTLHEAVQGDYGDLLSPRGL